MTPPTRRTPEEDAEDDASTRTILSAMNAGQLSELLSATKFYATMRPDVKAFLYQAEPETLKFLTRARMEEIRLLEHGIKLVSSSQTVGRFMKWAILTGVGAVILGSQFADSIKSMFGWWRVK